MTTLFTDLDGESPLKMTPGAVRPTINQFTSNFSATPTFRVSPLRDMMKQAFEDESVAMKENVLLQAQRPSPLRPILSDRNVNITSPDTPPLFRKTSATADSPTSTSTPSFHPSFAAAYEASQHRAIEALVQTSIATLEAKVRVALDQLAGTLEQELEREQSHLLLMQDKIDSQTSFLASKLDEVSKRIHEERTERLASNKVSRERLAALQDSVQTHDASLSWMTSSMDAMASSWLFKLLFGGCIQPRQPRGGSGQEGDETPLMPRV